MYNTIPAMPFVQKASKGSLTSGKSGDMSSLSVSDNVLNEVDIIQYFSHACNEGLYRKIDNFAKALSSPDTDEFLLIKWLRQLRDNVFFLDKENEKITAVILNMKWTCRRDEIIVLYRELIMNLVSAHPYYLRPVLNAMINMFLSVKEDENTKAEEEGEKRILNDVHNILRGIISLVPMSPPMLCNLLSHRFPYFKRPKHQILSYIDNVLTICSYMPSHRLNILIDLVDKYLQIDVHCPRETIELWESEREENEVNSMDMEMAEATVDSSKTMAYPSANTLDVIMENFFNFIESSCYSKSNKQLNWEATKKLYRELLTVFDKVILPTYGCSHVQFVMFYICSLKPALCEGFIDYLWKKVKDYNTSPLIREAASFYIGSLLARATYINIDTTIACFDLMSNWAHSYINNHDSSNSADLAAHGTFYCVCQTLFYVFAFRYKEFVNMKNGFKYLRTLNFERIITSQLNPLKFCQPMIVQNFASVSRNYQIAYCYPVIERNNRSLVLSAIHSDNFAALNTFFAFDPYLLKRSKSWIDPIYRVYENDDVIDEDDSITEEREDPHQMFSYGSSPGFKQF